MWPKSNILIYLITITIHDVWKWNQEDIKYGLHDSLICGCWVWSKINSLVKSPALLKKKVIYGRDKKWNKEHLRKRFETVLEIVLNIHISARNEATFVQDGHYSFPFMCLTLHSPFPVSTAADSKRENQYSGGDWAVSLVWGLRTV